MKEKVFMKGYKAFNKGMVCRGKQYAENTVFEEDSAEICASGMHFCKSPLDVLKYYPLVDKDGNVSEFAEVEALDEAKIGSSGYYAKINSTGKYAVICCAGNNSIAKGKKGSWITLSEWVYDDKNYIPKCVKTEYIDGEKIKEDTFYKLQGGEFVEVEE